ncbi:hypothetical protein WMY93_005226 [Mugilogobius chulae]|uniref:Adenomatous polyposis coli N-terminal dimerisation domain-containing protein n=1 Tax=Mugilogobius chulae TaxID=88201 RepID=A0AAW0PQP6_9GOBI
MGSMYELQDTIHSLKEENLHLQHRLENLTHALRDLKHLLSNTPKGKHMILNTNNVPGRNGPNMASVLRLMRCWSRLCVFQNFMVQL